MKVIVIVLILFIACSCNRKNFGNINDDRNLYNEALSTCVDYIVNHEIFIGETDTMYFDSCARIDTNSVFTYGIYNGQLFHSYIDSSYTNIRDMNDTEFGFYKNIQSLRKYSKIHDFDSSSFNIPVKSISFRDAKRQGIRQYYVNIVSPLISGKIKDSYFIWISKWLEPFNDNYGLVVSLKMKNSVFEVVSHKFYFDGDNDGILYFKPTSDRDYIRDLKRKY